MGHPKSPAGGSPRVWKLRGEARTVASLGVDFPRGYSYERPKAVDNISAAPRSDLVAGRAEAPVSKEISRDGSAGASIAP